MPRTAALPLPITSDGYLLLGIPLTAALHLCVRRRRLRELLVRSCVGVPWDRRTVTMATVLAVIPGAYAVGALRSHAWTSAA